MTFLPRHNSPSSHEALRDIKHPAQLRLRYDLVRRRETRSQSLRSRLVLASRSATFPITGDPDDGDQNQERKHRQPTTNFAYSRGGHVGVAPGCDRHQRHQVSRFSSDPGRQVMIVGRHVPGYHAYAVL